MHVLKVGATGLLGREIVRLLSSEQQGSRRSSGPQLSNCGARHGLTSSAQAGFQKQLPR